MNNKIKEIVIPNISSERKYWLVRTDGGRYYPSFDVNNYIAIGWNKIDEEFFKKDKEKSVSKLDIFNLHPEAIDKSKEPVTQNRRAQFVANQLNKFIHKIKKGDIVLIPSDDSKDVTFGEVIEDQIYFETGFPEKDSLEQKDMVVTDRKYCPYIKRKKVRWIQTIFKDDLDPELHRLFHSQQTIVEANDYATYIDRSLDSIFIKGDKAHLTLYVQKEGDINALEFSGLIRDTLNSIDSFKEIDFKIDPELLDKNRVSIKTNVQSPGPIEFIGSVQVILPLVSLLANMYHDRDYKIRIKNLFGKIDGGNTAREIIEILQTVENKNYTNELEVEKLKIGKHFENLGITNPDQFINSTEEETKEG